MLHRHVELRANVRVTGVTEERLLLCEKVFGRGRLVDRMAIGADDIRLRVGRAADIGARHLLRMAGEAGGEHLTRIHLREGANAGFSAARRYVISAGTVASFAARLLRGFFSGSEGFEMRIFAEVLP